MKEEIKKNSESKKEEEKREVPAKKIETKSTGNSSGVWMAIAITSLAILLIIGGYFAFKAVASSDLAKNLFKKETVTTLPAEISTPAPTVVTEIAASTGLPAGTANTTSANGTSAVTDNSGTAGSSGTPEETTAETAKCNPDSQFDSDVTIPDSTSINSGTAFTKTWRIKNNGDCTWADGTKLVRVSGTDFCSHSSYDVAPTAASTTTDLSIDCTAPNTAGTYKSTWQLKSPDGVRFGNQFSLKIVVPVKLVPFLPPPLILNLVPWIEQVKSDMVTVPGNGYKSATATCPDNSIVVGGGFGMSFKIFAYTQMKSGNGWQVYAKNTSPDSKLLVAYATCLHNYSNGSVTQKMAQINAAANGIGHATVSCPAGTIVTSGGYASNPDKLRVYNSTISGNGWQVYVQNKGASEELFNVYATCLTAQGNSMQKVDQFSVGAGAWSSASTACPSGALATSGGFAMGNDLTVYNSWLNTSDKSKWSTYAVSESASSQLVNAYATCLTLQ